MGIQGTFPRLEAPCLDFLLVAMLTLEGLVCWVGRSETDQDAIRVLKVGNTDYLSQIWRSNFLNVFVQSPELLRA